MPHDQCPSTVKGEKKKPGAGERAARVCGAGSGAPPWRSPAELADSAGLREFVEREFPAGASELLESDRRGFMKVMGASLALAGMATVPGCRRPEHKIMPYAREAPEEVVPGKPLFYGAAMPLPGGGAEGLLVETHEGRPTKVEGNPLHPLNRGRSSVWAQASVLSLYDPDRLKTPVYLNPSRGPLEATWDDFKKWAFEDGNLRKFDATGGAGLAIVIDKATSPSRDAAKAALMRKWPRARWVPFDGAESAGRLEAGRAIFGGPVRELYSFDRAKVVVSIDRDFLNSSSADEPNGLRHAREFAAGRDVRAATDSMNRLYVVEPSYSITGGQADHHLRLAPSRCIAFAALLARRVLAGSPAPAGIAEALNALDLKEGAVDSRWLDAVAEDLLDPGHRGRSVVCVGPHMAAAAQALVWAINSALGNVGQTVRYVPMGEDEGADSIAGLTALIKAMNDGLVDTLVCVNTNPLYAAPAALGLGEAMKKVAASVTLSVESTETAAASTWSLPGAHVLESWGDAEACDGTVSIVQPMIAPLYGAPGELGPLSPGEFLAFLGGDAAPSGYELVRASWQPRFGADFEKRWKRSLHDGVVAGVEAPAAPTPNAERAASLVRALDLSALSGGLEVVVRGGFMHDGRFANVSWLQELPQHGTRVVWDNPALVSPATAKALGLTQESETAKFPEARVARLSVGGRAIEIPVWATPGVADDTVVLQRGYGRRHAGVVGDGVGVDVGPILDGTGAALLGGGQLASTGRSYPISSTQHHWTMESRTSIVREVDLAAWKKHGGFEKDHFDPIYGRKGGTLNLAERLGELAHTPPNVSSYVNPLNQSRDDASAGSAFSKGPQWGMSIDLARCTGCGACTIACQAENNIPAVGKRETQKGREMAWIRVDRYFTGDDINEPAQMLHQPVACLHCENAPCEVVCPVNATVHGPEGLNYMTYNRCIGTRYCANNCPYKVRRFNFFDYGVTRFNGGYFGKGLVESIVPDRGGVTGSGRHNKLNPNLIPPRLRQKLEEISKLQKNPDVTVRSRGVMEKCTFCIQRINQARVETKLRTPGLTGVPDGFFESACQQACPSEAIAFGDILDGASRVHGARVNGRSYGLLAYLNTRPRTTYMLRVNNPNPRLRAPVEDPFHHSGEPHDDHKTGAGQGEKHGAAPDAAGGSLVGRRRLVRGITELSLKVLGA